MKNTQIANARIATLATALLITTPLITRVVGQCYDLDPQSGGTQNCVTNDVPDGCEEPDGGTKNTTDICIDGSSFSGCVENDHVFCGYSWDCAYNPTNQECYQTNVQAFYDEDDTGSGDCDC